MGSDNRYDLFQGVIALQGITEQNHRWQFSAQHGVTELQIKQLNDYQEEHWRKGVWGSFMDPQTYEVRFCDAACTPINVFQPLTAAAINDLKLDPHQSRERLTQSVINPALDCNLLDLPARPVNYALGFEHRRAKSRSILWMFSWPV
ncbi:hypothetical protein [Alishewanella longhuensis]